MWGVLFSFVPYTKANPPDKIKAMPKGAQSIWIAAFNSAWEGTCSEREDKEACANQIAYSAVKAKYTQDAEGKWKLKESRMNIKELVTRLATVFAQAEEEIAAEEDSGAGVPVVPSDGLLTINANNVTVRTVVDVEDWSGKVEDYASAADYCDASLINLNTGNRDAWDAGMCKMAVIKPGGTAYVSAGIRAAASAIGKMEKPNGVNDDDWKNAKRKAANKIIAAFNEMDETAPDAVYKAAGKTAPKRTIAYSQIQKQVMSLLEQVNANAYTLDPSGYPVMDWEKYLQGMDIYYDDEGGLFLLAQRAGKLFRLPVAVEGDAVSLGEPEEINLTGRASRTPSTFFIYRDAGDGSIRWFATAAAAVLNRVNQIDSTELFDNFIRRAKETGRYPSLSFYHHKDEINLGQADWLGRSEYLYLASGKAANTPDGLAAMRALEGRDATDTEWGCSIGYYPIGEPDMLEVARGIEIPVYTDGINDEISIVRESDAASYYTRMGKEEEKRMRKNEKDALIAMFGEARANEIEAEVDRTDRAIIQEDLIRREAEATAPGTTEPAAEAPPAAASSTTVFEINEEMLTAISEAVASRLQSGFDALGAGLAALTPRVEAMETAQRALTEDTSARLGALETEELSKKKEWLRDLPSTASQRSVVVIRPSQQRKGQEEEEAVNYASVAQSTVAQMKTRR